MNVGNKEQLEGQRAFQLYILHSLEELEINSTASDHGRDVRL